VPGDFFFLLIAFFGDQHVAPLDVRLQLFRRQPAHHLRMQFLQRIDERQVLPARLGGSDRYRQARLGLDQCARLRLMQCEFRADGFHGRFPVVW
jgi:hypothetical protein